MRENGSMKTMKKMFAMAFVAVVGLAGCQQELVDPDAVESDALKVFATIEDADDTKTSLNDREVYWTSGDRIAVFMNKTLRKRFEVSSESVGTKEGTFLYDSDYIVTGKSVAISNNVAYYPFCEVTCAVSGSTYTLSNVTIPTTQDYAPASFGQGAFPMVAVTADTDDSDFAFKNLCGVLAFQLKGSGTVRSITVEGNSDEILSGKATVTASFGKNPEISLLTDGSKTVILDCGETGVVLQNDTPTSFYIVLPPVSFDNGFTITVTDASGAAKEYSTTKKNVIHRSGILRMPEKEYIGERVPQEGDYIDENGINHGQGVKIGETVWAPVNCGYHATDYAYGKLYQWGRKYGQGYSGELYDSNGNYIGKYSDSVVPEIVSGPVSSTTGQSKDNENKFYYNSSSPNDWCSPQNDKMWNSGTEDNPVKAEYDPCPDGWRVPTCAELNELNNNYSSWTTNEKDQPGYWFSGSNSYTETVPQVFFPAAGRRARGDGSALDRGYAGCYWSSRPISPYAYHFSFSSRYVTIDYTGYRADGRFVRCVQEYTKLIPVESIILNKTDMTLSVGDSESLSVTIIPSNANHRSAHWWSDNPEIASVDQNGKVTAVSAGTTTIYARAGMQVATCKVTVNAKKYPVTGVTLDKTSCEMTEGDEFTLTATINPSNATNKNVSWKSRNTSVARVSNGKVTALRAGSATITVTTEDGGKTATCEVTVNPKVYPVTGVTLDKTSYEMTKGDDFTLTATITPDNATNKNVSWKSSNTSVATVSNGKVTAIKAGSATIIVTTEDGGKTATCVVTVIEVNHTITEPVDENSGIWTENLDYIDEYGINHGPGVKIGSVIWAPVNCGYHQTNYKYGKLFQWGRKYGQGHDRDATTPQLIKGKVSDTEGNLNSNANKYYYYYQDWVTNRDDELWNSGTESCPVKTVSDPCPEGWRVPTRTELNALAQNHSYWTVNDADQVGYWLSGEKTYTEDVPQVFFPAAGYRGYLEGLTGGRGDVGYYWSSTISNYNSAYHFFMNKYDSDAGGNQPRADAFPVRCVQE